MRSDERCATESLLAAGYGLFLMIGFGLLVISAGAALHHRPADLAVLATAFLACALIGLYLLGDLRSAPSGFPWPDGQRSGTAPAPPSGAA